MSKSSTAGGRKGARDTRQAAGGLGAREGGARPGMPDPSRAIPRLDPDQAPAEIMRELHELLGPNATLRDVASIFGAPDDSSVKISAFTPGHLTAKIEGSGFHAIRSIKREGGDLVIDNHLFVVTSRLGKGDNAMNGYYTWPRFGYDRKLNQYIRENLPKGLKGARTVLDVMRTPQGRDWWKRKGNEGEMSFDLRPGSRSRKVLTAYIQGRRKAGTLSRSMGLKLFARQVNNAAAMGVRRIDTFAAGDGPEA